MAGVKNKASVPTGVKVIAVLEYIGAALSLIFGLIFILGGSAMGALIPMFGALGGIFLIIVGIIMLGLAVLGFFIGRGLWKAQKWARIIVIVFSCIGVLFGLISLIGGAWVSIITIIINGAIGGYLWFAKEAKEAFA